MELNKPDEAPLPVDAPLPVNNGPEPGSALVQHTKEQVAISESPERAIEVSQPEDTIVSATAETVIDAEPQLTPEPKLTSPPPDVPDVIIVAPSASTPDPPAKAEESIPSPSSKSPSDNLYPPASSTSTSTRERSRTRLELVPVVSWVRSSLATLRRLTPARRSVLRWRTPFCYSLAVVCYSLTWYLHRRPPQEVKLSYFEMY